MVWVGDSIAHHIDFDDIKNAVKTKMKKKKAYGSVKASGQKFPNSNFTEVVPRVMQASSVDLTNSPASKENSEQVALVSSQNILTVAKNALAYNPSIK